MSIQLAIEVKLIEKLLPSYWVLTNAAFPI